MRRTVNHSILIMCKQEGIGRLLLRSCPTDAVLTYCLTAGVRVLEPSEYEEGSGPAAATAELKSVLEELAQRLFGAGVEVRVHELAHHNHAWGTWAVGSSYREQLGGRSYMERSHWKCPVQYKQITVGQQRPTATSDHAEPSLPWSIPRRPQCGL